MVGLTNHGTNEGDLHSCPVSLAEKEIFSVNRGRKSQQIYSEAVACPEFFLSWDSWILSGVEWGGVEWGGVGGLGHILEGNYLFMHLFIIKTAVSPSTLDRQM